MPVDHVMHTHTLHNWFWLCADFSLRILNSLQCAQWKGIRLKAMRIVSYLSIPKWEILLFSIETTTNSYQNSGQFAWFLQMAYEFCFSALTLLSHTLLPPFLARVFVWERTEKNLFCTPAPPQGSDFAPKCKVAPSRDKISGHGTGQRQKLYIGSNERAKLSIRHRSAWRVFLWEKLNWNSHLLD